MSAHRRARFFRVVPLYSGKNPLVMNLAALWTTRNLENSQPLFAE